MSLIYVEKSFLTQVFVIKTVSLQLNNHFVIYCTLIVFWKAKVDLK